MEPVTLQLANGVALVVIDDGKVNALSLPLFRQINTVLDSVEAANVPVVISGRPGIFSAGFDLKQMASGDEAACGLLVAGAELCLRLLNFRRPVVAACSGHAYPMGAFMLLSSDYRVGADGAFRIGLNEAKIGLVTPRFALDLARWRLTPPAFNKTVLTGAMFSPSEAVTAGFLDEVCSASCLTSIAIARAQELSAMPADVQVQIKRKLRAELIDAMRSAIDAELNVETLQAGRRVVAGQL